MGRFKKIVSKIGIKWFVILILLVTFLAAGLYRALQVTHYNLSSDKITNSFTIALIADLHCTEFGENNQLLIEKIKAGKPDIIVLAGDIYRSYGCEQEREPANHLVEECVKIAPTYFVAGNHEKANWAYLTILEEVSERGATVLDNEYIELEINQNSVILAGATDPYWDGYSYLKEIQQLDGYKIMLTHYPMSYVMYEKYDFDLMLAGHAHGGQVRIPLLFPNGLYSPGQGYFPKYTGGLYEINDDFTLIVSCGLSLQREAKWRVFNRPELVFVTIG
jgi:hypothetical protein